MRDLPKPLRATQVIEKLQALIAEHGDCDCNVSVYGEDNALTDIYFYDQNHDWQDNPMPPTFNLTDGR